RGAAARGRGGPETVLQPVLPAEHPDSSRAAGFFPGVLRCVPHRLRRAGDPCLGYARFADRRPEPLRPPRARAACTRSTVNWAWVSPAEARPPARPAVGLKSGFGFTSRMYGLPPG